MDPLIEDGGSGGGFQRVTSKLTGVLENSLFHFIQDNCAAGLAVLQPYQIEDGSTPRREVLYLKPKAQAAAAAASGGATYFRGIAETDRHISVDLKFSQSSAPGARGFSPAHLTINYSDMTLHVYFDRHGKMLNHHVKSVADGTYLDLTPAENAQIRREAASVETFLQSLIAEKQQAYQALDEQLTQQEMALSQIKTKSAYITAAGDYLALLEKANRYSDTQELRNKALIEDRIARFQEVEPVPVPAVVPVLKKAAADEAPEAAASVSDETTPERAPQKTIKTDNRKAALEALVKKLNAQHASRAPLSVLLGLFFEVETLSLDIVFESKKNGVSRNQRLVQTQKAKLTFNLEQIETEFRERLAAGDLAYVKDAYPQLVGIIPMGAIFQDFITYLPAYHGDDALVLEKLKISDYLYEQTETYRSLFLIRLRFIKLRYEPLPELTVGYLVAFFLKNNWVGFQAMLEKYGDLHSKEQLICNYNHAALNSIQALLVLYPQNPEIKFLDALLAYGMPLTHQRENQNGHVIFDVEMQGDKLVKKAVRVKQKPVGAGSAEEKAYDLILAMQAENHALKSLMKFDFLFQYPELVAQLFMKTEDIESLFECLVVLTFSRFISADLSYELSEDGTKIASVYRFEARAEESTDEKSERILALATEMKVKTQHLFEALQPEAQRDVMRKLFECGQQAQGTSAGILQMAAQVAYTMLTENTVEDDAFMCHVSLSYAQFLPKFLKTTSLPLEMKQAHVKKAYRFPNLFRQMSQSEAKSEVTALEVPALSELSVFSATSPSSSDADGAASADTPKPVN